MASRQDAKKRRAWEERLGRYQASSLTVTRFCEQERVSTHTFYYWAKRIGSISVRRSAKHVAGFIRPVTRVATAAENSNTAWVHFRWNAAMEVSVPADCLDAIRCLAECFRHASIEHDTAEHTDAFQEVVVRS